MTVFIDDMYKAPMGRLGRMKMSHMMADTREELIAMAQSIGLSLDYIQYDDLGRSRRHFDVSKSYREKAINNGAIPVTMRELARKARAWRTDDAEKCNPASK